MPETHDPALPLERDKSTLLTLLPDGVNAGTGLEPVERPRFPRRPGIDRFPLAVTTSANRSLRPVQESPVAVMIMLAHAVTLETCAIPQTFGKFR
jgi:hypothetical protein